MEYAEIQAGTITQLAPRPNWLDGSGRPVTDATLKERGWLPIEHESPPYNALLQRLVVRPDTEWAVETERVVVTYEVRDISLEDMRAAKLRAATAKRWGVETGGLALPGDIRIATGTEDQNRITTVIANAQLAGVESVDFKASSGWVTLTLAEIEGIAAAIALHVQACFTAERAHHEAIALLEGAEDIAAYDISVGWPA